MNKQFSISKVRFFFIPILILLLFVRCDDDEIPFPYVHINAILYVDTDLGNMTVGQYTSIDGYGLGGLIIYRKDYSEYLAFDRACTYEVSRSCKLEDDDTFDGILQCPCCSSKFWMTGEDLAGSNYQGPASVPLKQYNCYLSGMNTLIIKN